MVILFILLLCLLLLIFFYEVCYLLRRLRVVSGTISARLYIVGERAVIIYFLIRTCV